MILNLGLCKEPPTAQTELDVFRGQWSYKLPLDQTQSGEADGYRPTRPFLQRCEALLGSFQGWNVLELGPLEGEITYAIHQMGVRRVTAVEARQLSYLKCLVAKNLLDLARARFMLGDFVTYLEQCDGRYDFCCAQGVLYHMLDPVRLLQLVAEKSERCFIGTHYYDEARLRAVSGRGRTINGIGNPLWNIPETREEREKPYERDGFRCVYYKHRYNVTQEEQENPDTHHHHGLDLHAYFMQRDDIVRCLEHFGLEVLDVVDEPETGRGPYVGIIAQRSVRK